MVPSYSQIFHEENQPSSLDIHVLNAAVFSPIFSPRVQFSENGNNDSELNILTPLTKVPQT